MNPNSANIVNNDFWYEMRGILEDKESRVKETIWKFRNFRRNKRIKVDDSKFDPIQKLAAAFNEQESKNVIFVKNIDQECLDPIAQINVFWWQMLEKAIKVDKDIFKG